MPTKPLEFSDLKIGETYIVTSPTVRIVRAIRRQDDKRTIPGTQATQGRATVETVPCLLMEATIPIVPVKGHITEKGATANRNILRGLLGQTEDEDFDLRVWHELWAERAIPKMERESGTGRPIDRGNYEPELYCHAMLDAKTGAPIQGSSLQYSGIANAGVVAERVAKLADDPFEAALAEEDAA